MDAPGISQSKALGTFINARAIYILPHKHAEVHSPEGHFELICSLGPNMERLTTPEGQSLNVRAGRVAVVGSTDSDRRAYAELLLRVGPVVCGCIRPDQHDLACWGRAGAHVSFT